MHRMKISYNNNWHTVAQFELIGSWNVSKICTIYGRIDVMPQNCEIAKQKMTTAKGRIVRFRTSSFILSRRFPLAWVHLMWLFWQGIHEFEFSEYRCISLNSFSTAFGDTQPRSHWSDFKASSLRFLESSHNGVSGIYTEKIIHFYVNIVREVILTKLIATTVSSGTERQQSATVRHIKNVPSRYTVKKPSIAATPAQAIRMPRIAGWL